MSLRGILVQVHANGIHCRSFSLLPGQKRFAAYLIPTLNLQNDGGMNRLQISKFNSNFYLQQVRILHLDVKVLNGQL